jgi:hypothetical protein
LEKLVPRTKRNQRKVLRSACRRCRCEVCAVRQAMRKKQSFYKDSGFSGRGGRCVAGWLLVRGLFAMRGPMRAGWLHSRGALRCDRMRCASRCVANWLRCNALRCAARCADCLRYNALHAGWLHSRGAGGAMLFSYAIEGFLGWEERV